MALENYTKKMYDTFGHLYQQTRDEKRPERMYNDFLEVPCMLQAVGNIKGKNMLDIGCGGGVHIQKYRSKGAYCKGIDISSSMIEIAKKRCPGVEFTVGKITELPYSNNGFDIVTASLIIDYVENLNKAFSEVNRVLKKGGYFYYSDTHPVCNARETFETNEYRYRASGEIKNKKTGKTIALGSHWLEGIESFQMVPGMIVKCYKRRFSTHLKAIVGSGFELVDFIDCKPVKGFKKYNPKAYAVFTKFPIFGIYVCRKK